MYRSLLPRCARQSTQVLKAGAQRSYAASSAPAPPFDWQDPLNAKNLLTEEEIAISETAESYCQEQLLPRVLRMYASILVYFTLHFNLPFFSVLLLYHLSLLPSRGDTPANDSSANIQKPTAMNTTTARSSTKWAL